MKIALDIDGVLLDFDKHWREFASVFLQRDLVRLNNEYWLESRYGITKEDSDAVWAAFFEQEKWATIEPYQCALDMIAILHGQGHEIVCVTAAPEAVEVQRRMSLQHLGLEAHEIEFTGYHHEGNTKHEALTRHAPDIFVDDQLFNLSHGKECNIDNLVWLDRGDAQMNVRNGADWGNYATHRIKSMMGLADIIERLEAKVNLSPKMGLAS